MRPPGSGRQVGAVTWGRGLDTERRIRGEGARALPVMGSEVLGTERGTRPDTGPLSAATSSRRKGEAGGGPGPGWGRAAEAGIFDSAWPPGGEHPAASAWGPPRRGPRPTPFFLRQARPETGRRNATRLRLFNRGPMAVLISSSSQSGLSGSGAKEMSY